MGGQMRSNEEGAVTGPVGYGPAREAAIRRFQKRLWRLINNRGWNQAELSRRSGIGKDVISTYVNGKHMPDPKNAQKLATAFDITAEELFPDLAGVEAVPEGSPLEVRAVVGKPGMFFVKVGIAQEMSWDDIQALMRLTQQAEKP